MTSSALTVSTASSHELRLEPPTDDAGMIAVTVADRPGWPHGNEIAMAVAKPSETRIEGGEGNPGYWCLWVRGACFQVLEADARRIETWLAQVQGVKA